MKKLKPWVNSRVIVKNPSIHKKGIFAKEPISKEELVLKYGGFVAGPFVTWLNHLIVGDYDWQISSNKFLIPLFKKELSISYYINHSCNPNLGCMDERNLIAKRNIKAGEELTLDYAMLATNEPYSRLLFYNFECLCKSKYCRKRITGDDWKLAYLQKKYKGYFTSYLERKIKDLRHNPH